MRLTIGILTYNSGQVITRCLETVVSQMDLGELGRDWKIICLDNASNDRIALIRLERKFPQVHFIREEKNRGFAHGHNKIMRLFPAEFHAVLNPDLLLAPDFLSKLLGALHTDSHFGSAVGKLFWWNRGGNEERTHIIDSLGLSVSKAHAFIDIGQGTLDTEILTKESLKNSGASGATSTPACRNALRRAGTRTPKVAKGSASHSDRNGRPRACEGGEGVFQSLSKPSQRFGGSGAAVVYQRSAIEKVSYQSPNGPECFDETMFLYKEDIDLAYRLLVNGHSCLYVPSAVGWHARSFGSSKARTYQPWQKRMWSAAHESLLLRKHTTWWPRNIRMRTALRQFLKWLYLLIFEPRVFFAARALLRTLEPEAKKRRDTIQHTVSFQSISHCFSPKS